jgi:hypothetical protein
VSTRLSGVSALTFLGGLQLEALVDPTAEARERGA